MQQSGAKEKKKKKKKKRKTKTNPLEWTKDLGKTRKS
jgi:hypothetical protein